VLWQLWFTSLVAYSSAVYKDDAKPYRAGEYDPKAAEQFYAKRWVLKIGRTAQLIGILGGWGIGVLRDKYEYGGIGAKGNMWEKNMPMRAKQILNICTRLGTTAIKIGQSLSIRGDILPAPYVKELSELQDRVKPFPTNLAKAIIEEELASSGAGSIKTVFRKISDEPVAAASIGQVFKAEMQDGTVVAIKVQRPDVINDIALDLAIVRQLAPAYKKAFNLNSDLVGLVDEWGRGFVDELDYLREATNGKRFLAAMQARGLDAVTTSEVIDPLSSNRILVTKWVDGERLSKSTEDDVGRLCGVALNAYLTMLLDTGLLHCMLSPPTSVRPLSRALQQANNVPFLVLLDEVCGCGRVFRCWEYVREGWCGVVRLRATEHHTRALTHDIHMHMHMHMHNTNVQATPTPGTCCGRRTASCAFWISACASRWRRICNMASSSISRT
jgi:hypothetical protein